MIGFLNYSCGQNSKTSETLQTNNTIQHNGKTYTLKEVNQSKKNQNPK